MLTKLCLKINVIILDFDMYFICLIKVLNISLMDCRYFFHWWFNLFFSILNPGATRKGEAAQGIESFPEREGSDIGAVQAGGFPTTQIHRPLLGRLA